MTNSEIKYSKNTKFTVGSRIAVLLVGVALSTAASAVAQSPQRDAAALSTLQNAVTALGGSNAVASIQDCILTGSILNADGSTNTFHWTIAGSEFRIETTTANGGTNVFLSGHGAPAWVMNGKPSSLNSYMARANLPFYLPPYVLVQELNNPIYTVKYVGVVQLNGTNVVQVHVSDDSDAIGTLVTSREWYFDPVSFLPVRVQYREPSNDGPSDYSGATLDMSSFVAFGGVMVPTAIAYAGTSATETISVGTVTFNSGVSPDVFDPPQGGK